MNFDPQKHHRRSIRLKGYDYSQSGGYFITICQQNRECLFGNIVEGEMSLNLWGNIVMECWYNLPSHYSNIELDEFIIMPNHLHGIMFIVDDAVGARSPRPDSPRPDLSHPDSPDKENIIFQETIGAIGATERRPYVVTLGKIVAYFKYQSTKRLNEINGSPGMRIWQRNYYEHIIRDEKELYAIRKYIIDNPLQWMVDMENPNR